MKRVLYFFLLLMFAAVFVFSAWNLGSYYLAARENQALYDDLAQRVEQANDDSRPPVYYTVPQGTSPEDEPTLPTATQPTEELSELPEETEETTEPQDNPPTVLNQYAELYLDNPDMVGWIKIEDTDINYPVMQTPNYEDYYLHRNFDGEYSFRGCIYVEESCDVFAPSDNVIIYGHNMKDGSMFGYLCKYVDQSFCEEHRYITFDTILEQRTYEIVAVFKTSASVGKGFEYNAFIDASSEEDFEEFASTIMELAMYDLGTEISYGDKLIMLSTCEYTLNNGRLVVVAKLVTTD